MLVTDNGTRYNDSLRILTVTNHLKKIIQAMQTYFKLQTILIAVVHILLYTRTTSCAHAGAHIVISTSPKMCVFFSNPFSFSTFEMKQIISWLKVMFTLHLLSIFRLFSHRRHFYIRKIYKNSYIWLEW